MSAPPYLLHHLLEAAVAAGPGRPALIDGTRRMDYAAFGAASTGCARRLRAAGLQRGDRVAIVLPKSIEECWAIFGISAADGVFVPINPLLKPEQMRHIIDDAGAKIIVTNGASIDALRAMFAGRAAGPLLLDTGEASWPATASDETALDNAAIGEDLAAILYTSGSTGRPKGVMLSHRNLLAGTRIVRTYLGIGPHDRILSVLPFSFDYGLNQLLTAVEQGAVTALLTFRFGDEIVHAIREHDITGLAGVPTVWAILTRAAPALAKSPPPALRYITNSGGAVPTQTVQRLRELMPDTRIFLMYGLTEAFRSTYLPPEEINRRPTSIGKAIPECEVFAVTPDGRRTRPGEPGILVHRGPTVSLGYWNRPEDTARVIRPNPLMPAERGGEPVCYSGDIVTQDDDGYFYFVGRGDAMIKSVGYRISPTEVEEVLMATGAFRQIAVIGLPDAVAGQRVHAVGVAADGSIDIPCTLKSAAEHLASFMVPRAIELVDALPITANGKVDYQLLVRQRAGHAER